MSIVAFFKNTMVADRLMHRKGMIEPVELTKVAKDANGALYGVVGLAPKVQLVIAAVNRQKQEGGSIELPMPMPDSVGDGDCRILIAYPDGKLTLLEWDGIFRETDMSATEFYAIGSGEQYAMGAMAAGADAFEAVGIATRFDAYSGRTIDAICFDDREVEKEPVLHAVPLDEDPDGWL